MLAVVRAVKRSIPKMLEVWSVQALVKEESSGLLMKTLGLEKELVELSTKLVASESSTALAVSPHLPPLELGTPFSERSE
jgi:hypothetical protein